MFSSDRRLGPVYQWTILTLLGLVYFLTTATTFTSLGVVLPGMLRELNWSWTDAGFGFTLLGLTCGLSSFLPSLLIRKTNVRLTLLAGLLLFLAGFTACTPHSQFSAILSAPPFSGLVLPLWLLFPALM